MEEEKKGLFSGINKELLDEVTKVLEKYSVKDIFFTLWYILTTISVHVMSVLEKKDE